MTNTYRTREEWLVRAMERLDDLFFDNIGRKLPEKMRVSCGFPRGHARAIGQCWDPEVSTDGTYEMFICPTQAEPIPVLATLLHEMVHACVGIKAGHKKPFKDLAIKEFGLAGKPTATFAEPNTPVYAKLMALAEELGPYPHAPMQKKMKPKKEPKWVRLYSPREPSYGVVLNKDKLEEFGRPKDPWGDEMKFKDEEKDDDDEGGSGEDPDDGSGDDGGGE